MTPEERIERMRYLMDKHGLSCPRVADILNIEDQTVRAIKSGRISLSEDRLRLLEYVLGEPLSAKKSFEVLSFDNPILKRNPAAADLIKRFRRNKSNGPSRRNRR